ncbi:MAG: hypothetical protein KDE51_20145 [Anaerolineales bacterium]|nr:hypothetical protein [Anaerolineales bacterium]
MNRDEILVLTLGVGAAAENMPNADVFSQKAVDNYIQLREMVEEEFRRVDADLLEVGPGSPERQEKLRQQIEETNLSENNAIMAQAKVVLENVVEYVPGAAAALKKDPEDLRHAARQLENQQKTVS